MSEAPQYEPQERRGEEDVEERREAARPVYIRQAGNGMATAGLVFGILGVVFGLVPVAAFAGIVFAIFALIFGGLGRRRARDPAVEGKGRATVGVILGVIAFVMSVIGIFVVTNGVFDVDTNIDRIEQEFQQEVDRFQENFEDATP